MAKKSKSILGKKLEFLENFWSFREFLEWFGVFWTDLEWFGVFGEALRSRDRLIYMYDLYWFYCVCM